MNSKTYQSTYISRRFSIAVFAIVLMTLPFQAFASHAAGGTCKHKGGLTVFAIPRKEANHAQGVRKQESARNMQRVAPVT